MSRRRARFVRCVAAAALVAAGGVRPAGAQAPGVPQRCQLEFRNTPTTRFTSTRIGDTDRYNIFLGGGVIAYCLGQGNELKSDSAEYYGDQGLLLLINDVHYTEPRVKVDSRRMTYYQLEERLLAEGDVYARMNTGTTMRGPRAEYFRVIPGLRDRERLLATGRPRMSLVQPDATGRPPEPTQVVADRVNLDGDSLAYLGGRVEIDRTDLSARGDSAFLDSGREYAQLMRSPSITSKSDRPFTLRGSVIDVFSRQRQVQRVLASRQAQATSEDMTMRADTIDLRVAANRLDRAYAWGASRARVTSPDRDILADSLEIRMPGQRLEEVRAIGGAVAETAPDTTRMRTTERDWIRGDSIIARFDSAATVPGAPPAAARPAATPPARSARPSATPRAGAAAAAPPDTARRRPRIRDMVADGNASALYQLESKQRDSLGRPALNYVRGRRITVEFREQQVQVVTVVERAVGMYLEPGEGASLTGGAGVTPAVPAARPAGAAPAGAPAGARPPARPTTTRPRRP